MQPEVKIVVSDVKTAPSAFNLLQDKNQCDELLPSDSADHGLLCILNPTIRFLRYSKLFNSRIGKTYDVASLHDDARAMAELDRDEDYIVNLKHRPFPLGYKEKPDLKQFISTIDRS